MYFIHISSPLDTFKPSFLPLHTLSSSLRLPIYYSEQVFILPPLPVRVTHHLSSIMVSFFCFFNTNSRTNLPLPTNSIKVWYTSLQKLNGEFTVLDNTLLKLHITNNLPSRDIRLAADWFRIDVLTVFPGLYYNTAYS